MSTIVPRKIFKSQEGQQINVADTIPIEPINDAFQNFSYQAPYRFVQYIQDKYRPYNVYGNDTIRKSTPQRVSDAVEATIIALPGFLTSRFLEGAATFRDLGNMAKNMLINEYIKKQNAKAQSNTSNENK